jgi:hypothetical protein
VASYELAIDQGTTSTRAGPAPRQHLDASRAEWSFHSIFRPTGRTHRACSLPDAVVALGFVTIAQLSFWSSSRGSVSTANIIWATLVLKGSFASLMMRTWIAAICAASAASTSFRGFAPFIKPSIQSIWTLLSKFCDEPNEIGRAHV